MMFKMVTKICPEYLSDMIPVRNNTYNIRDSSNIGIRSCRRDLYKNSFLPYTIKLWNALTQETRNSLTISSFNYKLKCQFKPNPRISKLRKLFFNHGVRYFSCIHARLRLGCSGLNDHLFKNLHVVNSPQCQCGAQNETGFHYFFECPRYSHQREQMLHNLDGLYPINTNVLLFGDTKKSVAINLSIVKEVHLFIKNSKRFN